MGAKEYKREIASKLVRIFGANQVKLEWDVAKNSRDDFTRKLYCPRIDIAIGPFNIKRDVDRDRGEINAAYSRHRYFINKLNAASDIKISAEHLNENPRCLFAIEIENTGSRKSRLGSIANAAVIGKIGIIVAFTEKSNKSLKKIREYLRFATYARKTKENISKNVVIISKNDFLGVLEKCVRGLPRRS